MSSLDTHLEVGFEDQTFPALVKAGRLLELRRSATDASNQKRCDRIAELFHANEWVNVRSELDTPGR